MALVILALAVWELIELWHHGSIFASLRARVELFETWLGELLGCQFCLTPWVSLVTIAAFFAWGLDWLVLALAVARLANLGNDLTHSFCRTPREAPLHVVSEDDD